MVSALAGLWDRRGRLSAARECRRQLDAQKAIGSDPKVWGDHQLAVGRRLLQTLPEDRFDGGPIVEGDGEFVLVGDVRLDNREDLGRALNLGREHLANLSDSSLLLKCLIAWGEGALDRLIGDFAFALWNRSLAQLTLARDYSGQRPLHYSRGNGFFAFASMPCGIHALNDVDRVPNQGAAIGFMRHQPLPPGETFFNDISQVPPGHLLNLRNDRVDERRWWNFAPRRYVLQSRDDCAEHARELLDLAVASRLRGGGPLIASHLSAGLDSSGVTATAAGMLAHEQRRLVAFTAVPRHSAVAFPGYAIADESELARLVVEPFDNVEHVAIEGAGSLQAVFERNVSLWERPVPNPLNDVWWSTITQSAAARGASVLLTAPMGNLGLSHSGDEIFSELLVSFRWFALARALSDSRKARGPRSSRLALSMLAPLLPRAMRHAAQSLRGRQVTPDFLSTRAATASPREVGAFDQPSKSSLHRRLAILAMTDPGVFNAGAAAGWRVDMRDALADKRLMEFALALPTKVFFDRGESRALARRTLSDRLPQAVLREHRKGLQAADWHLTLLRNRTEMMAEAEAIGSSSAAGIIDSAAMVEALHKMPRQDWTSPRTRHVYGRALVGALAIGHFLRSGRP